ncbi:uncharacterized protein LOC120108386 [Phoenix dactylifera]|uniref:Uncharacterized protein LOC120108384 n=1 Tax=Phoenix dactylifera TaxID=42345 RepID=A0A8B9A248_PHODC|nr:uncharacterized protein LOC120108384 [Phoenix dactylifera]XP_038977900.1 uncharacterized protein LOC120108386 [Phoenix dactylifera]
MRQMLLRNNITKTGDPTKRHALGRRSPSTRADDPTTEQVSSAAASPAELPASATANPTVENQPARVRLKYRSGTGKKAEQRRARKSGGSKTNVMRPPMPLKEAVAATALAVEEEFSPYSENGRLAGLGQPR